MSGKGYDAIVLGTGGVGAAALFHLAARGQRVLGIDRFNPPHDRGSSHGETRVIRKAYFEHPDYVPMLERAYTLWQELHEVEGYEDHREDEEAPLDVQYGPAHDVLLEPGGVLRRLAGSDRIRVNSLHGQGVDKLGSGLVVEARAPDGVIEAFRVNEAPRFALAVQWHPEWQVMSNSFSRGLFAAFGAASRERAEERKAG